MGNLARYKESILIHGKYPSTLQLPNTHNTMPTSPRQETRLQPPILDRPETGTTFAERASKYHISAHQLKRAWKQWTIQCPDSQPESPDGNHLKIRPLGKPDDLSTEEEDVHRKTRHTITLTLSVHIPKLIC